MKKWNKLAALVLSFTMLAPFAACDKDGKDDEPEKKPNPPAPEVTDETVDATFVNGVLSQLEKAKTITVTLNGYQKEENKSYSEVNYNDGYVYVAYTGTYESTIVATVTLAVTETGVDAKVEAKNSYKMVKDYEDNDYGEEDWNDESESESVSYLIDGYGYEYDEEFGKYVRTPQTIFEMSEVSSATEVLSVLLNNVDFSIADEAQLVGSLAEAFNSVFTFKNNVATQTVDMKKPLEDLIAYVKGVDATTKTLRSLVNDALALVELEGGKKLTVEQILTELQATAEATPVEAYDAVDAWLTTNYKTTIQGVYDSVVADEKVATILTNYFTQMGTAQELTGDDLTQFVSESMNAVKAMNLKEMLTQAIAEMPEGTTIYDLIFMMSGAEGEAMTVEEISAQVNQILDMTIAQADENLEMAIEDTFANIENIKADVLKTTNEIKFDSAYNVTSCKSEISVDVSTSFPYENDQTKIAYSDVVYTTTTTIVPSATATTIALPSGAESVVAVWDGEDELGGIGKLDVYYPSLVEDEFVGNGYVYLTNYADGGVNYYGFDYVVVDENTLTITIDSVWYYVWDEDISDYAGFYVSGSDVATYIGQTTYTVELNYAEGTYEIAGLPSTVTLN